MLNYQPVYLGRRRTIVQRENNAGQTVNGSEGVDEASPASPEEAPQGPEATKQAADDGIPVQKGLLTQKDKKLNGNAGRTSYKNRR